MIYRNNRSNTQGSYFGNSYRDDRNVNIEISYDNFDTINLDQERKRQYAQDLRDQIEENQRRKREAAEKKRLADLEDELRLKREQELIDKRQEEENKRYRPKIDLPVKTIEPVKPLKKVPKKIVTEEDNIRNFYNRNYFLNENTSNYLIAREKDLDNFNNNILGNLNMLNDEYQTNLHLLKGEINLLTDANEKTQRFKDKLYKEMNDIKSNLDFKRKQDRYDSRNIFALIDKTNYTNQIVGNVHRQYNTPHKTFQIKTYVTNDHSDYHPRFYVDDERKGDGIKLSPYVNLSHVISYDNPQWYENEDFWA